MCVSVGGADVLLEETSPDYNFYDRYNFPYVPEGKEKLLCMDCIDLL